MPSSDGYHTYRIAKLIQTTREQLQSKTVIMTMMMKVKKTVFVSKSSLALNHPSEFDTIIIALRKKMLCLFCSLLFLLFGMNDI